MPTRVSLKETLEAATPGPWDECWLDDAIIPVPDMRLALLAPELAALALDMGEALEYYAEVYDRHDDRLVERYRALLARLDQLGKEPSDG